MQSTEIGFCFKTPKKKYIIQVKHLAGKSSILAMHARLVDRKCGNIFLLKNERIMNFKGLHTYMKFIFPQSQIFFAF